MMLSCNKLGSQRIRFEKYATAYFKKYANTSKSTPARIQKEAQISNTPFGGGEAASKWYIASGKGIDQTVFSLVRTNHRLFPTRWTTDQRVS